MTRPRKTSIFSRRGRAGCKGIGESLTSGIPSALSQRSRRPSTLLSHVCACISYLAPSPAIRRARDAADIVRIENDRLAEHWNVLHDEATKAESKSGLPMFGDRFPA